MNLRHSEILNIARRDGTVLVEDLAARFDVTLQTIRRDLADLAQTGQLERVHGGAVLPSGIINIAYEERRTQNKSGKTEIADLCADWIKDGSSIFLGIGTTTEAVAQALRSHQDLLIVTNNINAARILAPLDRCQIIVTGGTIRAADNGLVGPMAVASVSEFSFDFAVLGCSALETNGGVFDYDLDEVSVSKSVLIRARATALVADAGKFERTAPARVADVWDFDAFFTDTRPPPSLMNIASSQATEVVWSNMG